MTNNNVLTQHTSNPFVSNRLVNNSTSQFDNTHHSVHPRGKPTRERSSSSSSTSIVSSKNPFHKIMHNNSGSNSTSPSNNNHSLHEDDHRLRNRAKSFLHIRHNTSSPVAQPSLHHPISSSLPAHPLKPLKRASTSTNLKAKTNTVSGCVIAPPRKHEKIVFNPYGINTGPRLDKPRDQSFYLEDSDLKNLLPMPIEAPNDYLPMDMKELRIELTDFYEIPERSKHKILGDGASADVRIINEIGNKNKKYALKNFILFKGETPDHFYKRVAAEFVIAKNISNGFHIVTTLELLRVQTTLSIHRGWGITMELCEGGDLFSLATSPTWRSVSSDEKYCIFKQICFGLKYMHERDVAHIDLKPENVLLTRHGVVKLTDFGISRFGHKVIGDFNSEINYIVKPVGSAPYSPPEMMELEKNKNVLVEPFKVDMWALGVLLSVLFYSKLPFNEASSKDEAYRRYKLSLVSFENKVNPGMKQIGLGPGSEYQLGEKFHSREGSYMCWRLMDPNDQRRYTLKELFCDPFFRKIKTCTDELNHLTDFEDELCNHDHVIEMAMAAGSNGVSTSYSSTNNSNDSLHKPVKSMLDTPSSDAATSTALSRTSSISSNVSSTVSSNVSSRISTKGQQTPYAASPIRSMLEPLPMQLSPPTQQKLATRASELSLQRKHSYDNTDHAAGIVAPAVPAVDDAAKNSPEEEGLRSRQLSSSFDLPPLKEEQTETITVIGDENGKQLDSEAANSEATNSEATKLSPKLTDTTNTTNPSMISLPNQHINKDTNFGDNDNLVIDREHGLVESHEIITEDLLQQCCAFDPKSRHRHVELK